MSNIITIQEWVGRVWPNQLPKVCYISIQDVDGVYDLEVEVSHDTIGGVYNTESHNLKTARSLANVLDRELTKRGVKVIYTRDEWEEMEDD